MPEGLTLRTGAALLLYALAEEGRISDWVCRFLAGDIAGIIAFGEYELELRDGDERAML